MYETIPTWVTWVGICLCASQSAMFSGLNLAFFSLNRLQLEVEAETNQHAKRILAMRQDSNLLLTTILWGNVGINVLLTLLSDSVMVGAVAFLVSTFVITIFGEILPQAYFSRNAMRMASLLSPVLRFYQRVLWPVAKPSARALDAWLGHETPQYFRENVVREMLIKHIQAETSDLDALEGIGAANFLAIDDLATTDVGELLDPTSIIELPVDVDLPRFPTLTATPDDPLLQQINASGKSWVVLTDSAGEPRLVIDADGFLRGALFEGPDFDPYRHCHRPIMVRGDRRSLGWVIEQLARSKPNTGDGMLENDVVLVWGPAPRIITGADILGRLLQGV